MALDGITIAALAKELDEKLSGGRISKIAQPESDELLLTIKTPTSNERLLLSAGASLPFVYLTPDNKPSPLNAPNFCMLLRKHISGGHIAKISQPGFERIIEITVNHLDEMGDACQKIITVELMGKHSNIIFRQTDGTIIDAIKHVSAAVSSVREVLPQRMYFVPNTENKSEIKDEILCQPFDMLRSILCKPTSVQKSLYQSFTGLSPVLAESLCIKAQLNSDKSANELSDDELCQLASAIKGLIDPVYTPAIISEPDGTPIDFEVVPLLQYKDEIHIKFDTVSDVLREFYAKKNEYTRIRQKSSDLRKIVQTALERNVKKYDIQSKQLIDTEKMGKYKVYGELLQTYGYSAEEGAKELTCDNYYTNEKITIPLDPTLSAMANSIKYFDRYSKLKRTKEAVTVQIAETKADMEHLLSISTCLDIAENEEDLKQIKDELIESGYIKKHSIKKEKSKAKSKPFCYISSDGFQIFVGKNNYQNDELTFKVANSGDWWFHAKKMPGSHVIVRCEGKELPDNTFNEAACLAAYYSAGKNQKKVEIDYVKRKEIKKPGGSKPGFVVYYTNYSMVAEAKIPESVEKFLK